MTSSRSGSATGETAGLAGSAGDGGRRNVFDRRARKFADWHVDDAFEQAVGLDGTVDRLRRWLGDDYVDFGNDRRKQRCFQ